MSRLWDRLAGGAVPIVRTGREVHVVDGADYTIELSWLRRGFTLTYHTPRTPRDARRAREADRRKTAEFARRALAGEQMLRVGETLGSTWTWIPTGIIEVRTSDFTVWRRAEGDERFPEDDATGELDRSQAYEWISWDRGRYTGGHSTTEGLLAYTPITILRMSGPVPAGE